MIESLENLSSDILTSFIREAYNNDSIAVKSFSANRIDTAVLSDVFFIKLEYSDSHTPTAGSSASSGVPKSVVVKFLRKDLPMADMFRVEMNFYTSTAPLFDFPFLIPRLLHASESCIMVHGVDAVDTYSVTHPHPDKYTEPILTRVAKLHAMFWKHDCSDLASPAGIGSSLNGIEKRDQFPNLWEAFLCRCASLGLDSHDLDDLRKICLGLSGTRRIVDLHDELHSNSSFWSMIHGDFHIGNMLFGSVDELWLVDWATCGRGNPLRDVAFFLIVSCRFWKACVASNGTRVDRYLRVYYDALCGGSQRRDFSYEDCRRAYRLCVMNQFVILVCFDEFCRDLAASESEVGRRKELEAHFEGVNLRACYAMLECCRAGDIG